MAVLTKQQLINKINLFITSNGNNEITGAQLNEILRDMADSSWNLPENGNGVDTYLEIVAEAGETISSGDVVRFENGKCWKCTSAAGHYGKAAGVARTAGNAGELIWIRTHGEISVAGWGLTSGDFLFVDAQAHLSSVPPAAGYVQMIGVARDADTVIININQPVETA